jgi:pyrroloquinoline quinone (PQQ) biosynthesis protein C
MTIVERLDARIDRLLQEIRTNRVWRTVTDPATPPELTRAVMREIYLEIAAYQPDVIEAAIATIGQMPRSLDERKVKAMLLHQAEEFSHGEMALRDYVALGGDEAAARSRRPSPAATAVIGVWWALCRRREPFAYLGALYPFEGLTPIVASLVKPSLLAAGCGDDSLEFITFHSEEDPKHTNLVRRLITDVAGQFPEAADQMLYGIESFLQVYPLPVWETALDRALAAEVVAA